MGTRAQHFLDWLTTLGLTAHNEEFEIDAEKILVEKLQNGDLLCHLVNVLKPGKIEKVCMGHLNMVII